MPIIIVFSFVSETGKVDPTPHTSSFNMGYLVSPYPYPNGAGGPIPVSMVSSPLLLVSFISINLACLGFVTSLPIAFLLFSTTRTRSYCVFCSWALI